MLFKKTRALNRGREASIKSLCPNFMPRTFVWDFGVCGMGRRESAAAWARLGRWHGAVSHYKGVGDMEPLPAAA